MQAIYKSAGRVSIRDVDAPEIDPGGSDVLVRVALAGICRTDVFVAQGRIPSADPLVLGHEFSGVVEAVGAGVGRVKCGDRVAVFPWVGGGMLGVDQDGGFADLVALPAACVYPVPVGLSAQLAAYCEPIAASMGVLKAGCERAGKGVLVGGGRIAELTAAVLRWDGYADITRAGAGEPLGDAAFDFAIETGLGDGLLDQLMRAVKPGGTIVLKSRPAKPVPFDVKAAVLKDIQFKAVNYAPFDEAIALAASGDIDFSPMFGDALPMADYGPAFEAEGRGEEAVKRFLAMGGSDVWDC